MSIHSSTTHCFKSFKVDEPLHPKATTAFLYGLWISTDYSVRSTLGICWSIIDPAKFTNYLKTSSTRHPFTLFTSPTKPPKSTSGVQVTEFIRLHAAGVTYDTVLTEK